MSENAQVKKLIQAYESLEGALDGFDWGTPQRCVLGSFTVDGVDGQDVTSHLIAEVCAITVPGTGHRGFVALAPMDFADGEGTWAWVRME